MAVGDIVKNDIPVGRVGALEAGYKLGRGRVFDAAANQHMPTSGRRG